MVGVSGGFVGLKMGKSDGSGSSRGSTYMGGKTETERWVESLDSRSEDELEGGVFGKCGWRMENAGCGWGLD